MKRRFLYLSGLAAVLLLASAASAMGQAAVDQYLPSTKPGSHHGSASHEIAEAVAGSATPAAPEIDGKGKTRSPAGPARGPGAGVDDEGGGFSLTPFVIIVIVLFLAGLAARYLPGLVRRLRPHPS